MLFKPRGAWAGDFIPFYWDGTFHLFYLRAHRDRDGAGEGTTWAHVATRDFVSFSELPDAIPHGDPGDQDLYAFTGSVVERDDLFHIFYTGHNPYRRGSDRPAEGVLHMVSDDLVAWRHSPLPDGPLFASAEYEPDDWRDPFVFRDEATGRYRMLLAGRVRRGPSNRRGVVALATSSDLEHWQIEDPFWAPSLYYTHECPDYFSLEGRHYLVYSEFTDRLTTRYRISEDADGPWEVAADDTLDTRAWYAAKTATDGTRRFAFGWLATRSDEHDAGGWQWGGHLVTHELGTRPDGSLTTRPPVEITGRFTTEVPTLFEPRSGRWDVGPPASVEAGDRFAWAEGPDMPRTCLIEVDLTWSGQVQEVGVLCRTNADLEGYYRIRLEPARSRVTFDAYRTFSYAVAGLNEPAYPMERPVALRSGIPVRLRVLIDGSAFVVYVNDEVALSTRGYDHRRGCLALYCVGGQATFDRIRMVVPDGAGT